MTKKKKAVWLFSGGPMQEHAAETIKALGYELILTDQDEKCACAKHASAFVNCDTFDIPSNLDAAENLRDAYTICAGVTVAADCHETVAAVNEYLELPGITPEIARTCRRKDLSREVLSRVGIPQPRFGCFNNFEAAKSFLRSIGGCGVVKATDNSGSRGFSRVDALEDFTIDKFELAVRSGTSGMALVEEVLIPTRGCISELSIETIWSRGKMYWLNWVDRLFKSDLQFLKEINVGHLATIDWAVEVGHVNPACHAPSIKQEVHAMIEEAGFALGMDQLEGSHVLKADVMLTENGPVIIELTPRLSGGWDSSGTTLARGADFQAGVIKLALGHQLDLDFWMDHFEFKTPNLYASIWADVPVDAKNCIGRRFALGAHFERETSLEIAFNNAKENIYVI